MRKATWILAAAVALALAATPVLAAVAVWDRYDRVANTGLCLMLEGDGDLWLIRYVDNPNSNQRYVFDPGQDRVLKRYALGTKLGGS